MIQWFIWKDKNWELLYKQALSWKHFKLVSYVAYVWKSYYSKAFLLLWDESDKIKSWLTTG